jgi:protein-disulfide isomerase
MRRTRTRRQTLATLGATVGAALAGCLGGGDDGSGDDEGLDSHPAAASLGEQPRLGPEPGTARGTIIAFEDPSCPRCRTFERETVPGIRAELVDPGDATFVFRGFPYAYEWGGPALRALEATFAADADAHWALLDHYFAEQDGFSGLDREQVLARTEEFLAAETGVDGEAVVDAVEAGDSDPAVEADTDAGEEAGVTQTPTVLLFREGAYRTTWAGSVDFDSLAAVLLSIYWLAEGMRGGEINGCPVDI